MEKVKKSTLSLIWRHFLKKILTGIAAIIPLGVTIFVLKFVFIITDGILKPLINKYYPLEIPGMGFILVILILYFLGLFSANILGKKILVQFEKLLMKIPVVKSVYNVAKQIVESLSLPGKQAFQRVVLVNFLGTELKSLGFVTGSSLDKNNEKWLHIFIPTTPNPTAGFIELVREDQVEDTKLSVEEGLKMILSGGVISPGKIA